MPSSLFKDIDSGKFGQMMREAKVGVWASECALERWLYGEYRAPEFGSLKMGVGGDGGSGGEENDGDGDGEGKRDREEVKRLLHRRLLADYSPATTTALLDHYLPTTQQSHERQEKKHQQQQRQKTHYPPSHLHHPSHLYGAVTSDIQVHALQRGFLSRITGLPSSNGTSAPSPASPSPPTPKSPHIHRTHISYLTTNATHANLKPEWGATHSSDLGIWFWGNGWGGGLTSREKDVLRGWVERFWAFVRGEDLSDEESSGEGEMGWGDVRYMKRLCADGKVDLVRDWDWERGLRVWEIVRQAQTWEEKELAVVSSGMRAETQARRRKVGAKL